MEEGHERGGNIMTGFKRDRGKKIALGGVVSGLSIVSLYLAAILPTNRLLFFALSSIFIAAVVIEYGVSPAFATYIAISVLGLVLVPNKLMMNPYIFFFGYYGIIKYYIEKKNRFILAWLIKIILFNAALWIMYATAKVFIAQNIVNEYGLLMVAVLAQVAFIAYDIGYTAAISYYRKNIRSRLKK